MTVPAFIKCKPQLSLQMRCGMNEEQDDKRRVQGYYEPGKQGHIRFYSNGVLWPLHVPKLALDNIGNSLLAEVSHDEETASIQ